MDGTTQMEVQLSWDFTSKIKNNKTRTVNGNRGKAINLVHWNPGSTHWPRKLQEIRQAMVEFQPDILTISEANLMANTPDYKTQINGYKMVQPPTMEFMGHCRLLVLVRDTIEVDILTDIMEEDLPTVWLRIKRRGRRNMIFGSIYREHHQLGMIQPDPRDEVRVQTARWDRISEAMGDCSQARRNHSHR